ncbi:hypothetical protein GLAREA_11706 [Glarea lozoyensis ATCC 20868]|uniref:DUF7730 domain-containing protein n=1 Tax=Glarea lozoyensis (strain ATCC 20868 / MF5171) TaxID=1116229 RepID=S3CGV9_GLAL2|nr:uncharacterized protein GLAREA_11706 [Glarea lozoyensis ATCC 20868]EPE25125.1 hypothetical protein GLAREA_11706 [Glarea lozoyensis ATCC 20868]
MEDAQVGNQQIQPPTTESRTQGQADPGPSSIRKRKRRRASRYYPREKLGRPFNAFLKNGGRYTKRSNQLSIEKEEGIHSQAWVNAINPQPESSLLALPYELKLKIYTYALRTDWKQPILTPHKNGRHYRNMHPYPHLPPSRGEGDFPCVRKRRMDEYNRSCETIKTYNALSISCRQIYFEVVGSGVLYRISIFSFNSVYFLKNYVNFINPRFRPLITNLRMKVQDDGSRECTLFCTPLFKALTENLRLPKLEIVIDVDIDSCQVIYVRLDNSTSIYRRTLFVRQDCLAPWAAGPWHLLAGTGLKELAIRFRNDSRLPFADDDEEALEFVRGVGAIIGCGGDDEGDGVERSIGANCGNHLCNYLCGGCVVTGIFEDPMDE